MTVQKLIAALRAAHSPDAEITVIDMNGDEVAPILTVDEDTADDEPREVHIVLAYGV